MKLHVETAWLRPGAHHATVRRSWCRFLQRHHGHRLQPSRNTLAPSTEKPSNTPRLSGKPSLPARTALPQPS